MLDSIGTAARSPRRQRHPAHKLYRNLRNGKFRMSPSKWASPSANEGKGRAGMGVELRDFDNSGNPAVVINNFRQRNARLYRSNGKSFDDVAMQAGLGPASRTTLGFGCVFLRRRPRRPPRPRRRNGHIDDTVRNIAAT